MKRHISTAAVIAVAVAAAVTGCSPRERDPFAGLSAEQIDRKASNATALATSMRLNGTVVTEAGSVDLNLAVDNKGSCSGEISPNGVGTVDIAKKGALAYIKGDEQFWRTNLSTYESSEAPPGKADDLIASLQGQWIKATKEMREGMGFDLCELDKLSGIVSLGMGSGLARGVDATENGQPIAVVYQRKGVRVTTMHVAKTGKPFPVRFLDAGDGMPTDVYLSDFNQPVDVAFPTADQVLDLSKVR